MRNIFNNTIRNPSESGISLDWFIPPFDEALEACELIKDTKFVNQRISIDFKRFERCTFLHCKLHLKYGVYQMIDCDLDSCEIQLEAYALGVATLLSEYFKEMPISFQNENPAVEKR